MGPGSVNVLRCSLFPEEILEDEEDVEVLPPISSFSSGSRVEEADGMGMGMDKHWPTDARLAGRRGGESDDHQK